ncbi:MAG: Exopolysaccharide biosynthesis protein, WecB/TagA/CpsF family [Candidatus Roizmanbacteria bacterium GW2011_GWA2_35_19]|uniref:Exopolysaccharide biosynthesis protein, WecB/TagA/CpsF family n=2 Tax=Candidatus Roizmaniibacteriota TaxID=1752723 RepID=A0A0G0C7P4_9BACT|nr:MAG: Exopolysaccharide biosynthesis protein, WecB/TagA/CpsF family [Candidatus Roizmanbacteria bacterium GW2011_GWC2_35_12]KKP72176.1 MAG: Exopolysaccharide biosynthesis protein, WecB/TagA/CpsF family [Candidatus Roizmanbacteria bacterium GW2011_GWA2_35_19]
MTKNKILGIAIPLQSKNDILEKIIKYTDKQADFCHVASLNPENLITTQENDEFKKVIETTQIKILDGIGVVIAARLLNIEVGNRYPGVELMEDLIKMASDRRLRVMLIGGQKNLALDLAKCYQAKYPEANFFGVEGILDIKKPSAFEEKGIFDIVADYKPHLVFVAFGSPYQELWIARHSNQFGKSVVMGVGGAFDYLSGHVYRAPEFIRKIGLEWFFRLLSQPWRWKRQLSLLKFIKLVLQEKWKKK